MAQHLKFTATATIPLPKKAGEAVDIALRFGSALAGSLKVAMEVSGHPNVLPSVVHSIVDDESPAPTEPKPRRRRRQALGQGVTAEGYQAPNPEAVIDRPRSDGTRSGSVATAPDPGSDPGPIPGFMRRSA